jgi:hypothetical protein
VRVRSEGPVSQKEESNEEEKNIEGQKTPRYTERKTIESKVPQGGYEAKVGAVEKKGVETIHGTKDNC